MKKNIQKTTLFLVIFVFSTVTTLAGEVQCPVVPTPTPPPEFASSSRTTPEPPSLTVPGTDSADDKLPEFIQRIIDTLSALF